MNNKIKNIAVLVSFLILVSGVFSSCTATHGSNSSDSNSYASQSLNSDISQGNAAEKNSEENTSYNAEWKFAFHDKTLPDEYVTPEVIAFYSKDSDGNAKAVNVPKEEVYKYAESMTFLPRTHFFEQYFPENIIKILLPVLDYAVAHKYYQCCIPSTQLNRKDVALNDVYLSETYRIGEYGLGCETIAYYEDFGGKRLDYTTVGFYDMDETDMEKYSAALIKAVEIVASVPDGYDEYQTALYLYHYITENVRYDNDDYYNKEEGYSLLYDALILNKTVCSGYTEALYYLYNLAGIECITVCGFLYFPEDNERSYHIWNIAKLGDNYYHFDSTWDEGLDIDEYSFFGVSTEDLQSYYERSIMSGYLEFCPECNETLINKWNYVQGV